MCIHPKVNVKQAALADLWVERLWLRYAFRCTLTLGHEKQSSLDITERVICIKMYLPV
jgi:hypothetical protein